MCTMRKPLTSRDDVERWELTIVNPIGTKEWVEEVLIPMLEKIAKPQPEERDE